MILFKILLNHCIAMRPGSSWQHCTSYHRNSTSILHRRIRAVLGSQIQRYITQAAAIISPGMFGAGKVVGAGSHRCLLKPGGLAQASASGPLQQEGSLSKAPFFPLEPFLNVLDNAEAKRQRGHQAHVGDPFGHRWGEPLGPVTRVDCRDLL